jgi:hypothetical protein
MNRFINTTIFFLFVIAWSGSVSAIGEPCEVSVSAVLPGGEIADGTFSDLAASKMIEWAHYAPGFLFEVTAPLVGDDVGCSATPGVEGDVLLFGEATVNGVPGFGFLLELEDNREAPNLITLVASLSYYPTYRTDGVTNFVTPKSVTIPAAIPVRVGGSASGKTRLILDNDITCTYLGTGAMYVFDSCNDSLDSGYVAGDRLDVSHAVLRIQQADRSFAMTSVEAELSFEIAPGAPDYYSLIVLDGDDIVTGTVIYTLATDVVRGDVDIIIYPPTSP